MPSGFLPVAREATFMFDFVVVAMAGILPVLTWSIWLIRCKRNYTLHKQVQVGLGVVLLVAVALFEIDIRLHTSWWKSAMASPYYESGILVPFLWVHLFFAISTTLLWLWTLPAALRRFPSPPTPGEHSRTHLRFARLAAIDLYCTGITGWIFYWMAFVAQ